MKRVLLALVLVFFFLALINFSFSQTETNEPILTIFLEQIYSPSEEINISFWFGFSNSTPLQNHTLNISLISENLSYNIFHQTDEKGEAYLHFDNLTEGNYNLTVIGVHEDKEFMNFSSFEVKEKEFEISTEKERYLVNEPVILNIIGPKNKNFTLFIESIGLNISFELQTDENGSYEFNQTFLTPGNYTARINEVKFDFEIFEEKIEKNLSLEFEKEINLGEKNELKIGGTPETDFFLEIKAPTNLTVFSIFAKTDENGEFKAQFEPNQTGNYTVNLTFETSSILDHFNVKESEKIEFKISVQKEEFLKGEQIDFEILGPANTSFKFSLEGREESLYDLATDENGKAIFSTILNETGSYKARVIFESNVYDEMEFSVIEEKNLEISVIEIKQGEAIVGFPVIWNKTMMLRNLMDSNITIEISDLGLPREAIVLAIEDEMLNETSFELPNQSKILKVQYETPAPVKFESEPEILNQTWIKKINVSSNSSLIYFNVSISSEVDPRVENLTLIFEGNDVTSNDSFDFQFNTNANWKIPELKEAHFELVGFIAQKNISLEGQIKIENQKDFVFDCHGEKIEGNSGYGILVLNSENVTIANCFVSGFEIGIFVKDSSHIKLLNNLAERNEQGIVFLNSNHNTLMNNTAENNVYHGILFYSSFDNLLENNRIMSRFDIKILEKLDRMLKLKE